ncbi:MAG: metalloprotease TldD [Proteobacteria bacterium]|nr:metalloprotease TldD [Pseudomonadota bacterium]
MTQFDTDKLFFERNNVNKSKVLKTVSDALSGMDDGELFLEYVQSENLLFDDGNLKSASFNTSQGFGLRSVLGEVSAYAHASEFSEPALTRASDTVRSIRSGHNGVGNVLGDPAKPTRGALYEDVNPLAEVPFQDKSDLLKTIDAYLRAKDKRVRQVSVSLVGNWQAVQIIRENGSESSDIRPLVRLNVSVVVEKDGRQERGSFGMGGRTSYAEYTNESKWKKAADEALRQALVNLDAKPAPAGEMEVVLGPGWPGVLLHEAVGHGLEGDFNRKKTSAFSGLLGKQVAAKGVTVVDDGTIGARRGSLNIDDEGTPTNCTTLIEDGILVNYIQDRMNARLMGMKPTGNGRRESYAHQPMPRMTNTYMLGGNSTKEEIISRVKNGIYAVNFGGGQVDITSGKFVFSASEAYRIENGKVTYPVKGATLIGNGPEAMKQVKAIGNDMALDEGIGTCGKDAQSVPCGVGQPTMLIGGLTVGGTEV